MNSILPLECTMSDDGHRLELHYGIQDYAKVRTGVCRLSEEKIQEIIHAKYEDIQKILAGIQVVWKN